MSVPWGFWSYSMSDAPGLCSEFCSVNLSPLCFVALSFCIWCRNMCMSHQNAFAQLFWEIAWDTVFSFLYSIRYVVQSWGIGRHCVMTSQTLFFEVWEFQNQSLCSVLEKAESERENVLTLRFYFTDFIKFVSKCLNSLTVSLNICWNLLQDQVWSSVMPLWILPIWTYA